MPSAQPATPSGNNGAIVAQPQAAGGTGTMAAPTAQAATPSAPANSNPGAGQAAVSGQGAVINGGFATAGPVSPPLIVTPNVSLGVTSANPVGATSATGSNQVGATSSTMNNSVTTPSTTIPQPIVSNPNSVAGYATATTGSPTAVSIEPGLNVWAGPRVMSNATPQAGGPTLADIARQYRARPQHATRTYTNDDIARLSGQAGTPATSLNAGTAPAANTGGVAGAASSAAPASNLPASDQPPMAATPQPPLTTPQPPAQAKPSPYTPPARPPQ